jgi:hypothetical protein
MATRREIEMEKFSASRAERIMNCSASGDLEHAIPNYAPPVIDPTATNAATRGTKMHELFAELVTLKSSELKAFVEAMAYVSILRSRRRFNVLSEQSEMADWLPRPVPTTADLVLYTQDEIHIVDFKWGKILVEVIDNEQLLYYAATYAKFAPKATSVTMHIVQPRANIFESWTVDTLDLAAFMGKAVNVQNALFAGQLDFMPGDHCTFCPANPHSRAAKGSVMCPAMMQILYPAPFDEDELLKEDS